MLTFGQAVRGALVRGILPDQEDKVADFRSHMKGGKLDDLTPDSFNIVLGSELARALDVRVRRQGDADRAAGRGDAGRRDPAPEDLHRQRPVRSRYVRVRQWSGADPTWRTRSACIAWTIAFPACA
jgi:hypothetical protein